ncbi:hypothetical protein MCC93_01940 [Morococcus cerebrosus]|uniref:Uncharacterized protein n=1 Tax=Morococcus cerebrosus TaxID=1056807 RepID=A0A0C1HFV1_9NEIS|nr:hypothetical protein MCC93_01940 [Morococcus cerebrosus]
MISVEQCTKSVWIVNDFIFQTTPLLLGGSSEKFYLNRLSCFK